MQILAPHRRVEPLLVQRNRIQPERPRRKSRRFHRWAALWTPRFHLRLRSAQNLRDTFRPAPQNGSAPGAARTGRVPGFGALIHGHPGAGLAAAACSAGDRLRFVPEGYPEAGRMLYVKLRFRL